MRFMKTKYQYIRFDEIQTQKKTSAWACVSSGPFPLGYVKWYGPWRRYCFFAQGFPVFSAGCLADIIDFLSQANKRHAEELAARHSVAVVPSPPMGGGQGEGD